MEQNRNTPANPLSILTERRNQAQQFMENQQRGDNWKASAASTLVPFSQIRNGLCRWPIGDPHNLETFRFCGCPCAAEMSYCTTHRDMAHTSNKPKTAQPRTAEAA